ncbi:unnamed protein product [Calypogeia fissa]
MATSMKIILLLLLPVLLATMQFGNGSVLINNHSKYTLTVYDMNTTVIIDALEPNNISYFPLDTAGPDLFQVTVRERRKSSSFNVLVNDNCELLLYSKGKGHISYEIHPLVNALPAAGRST